MFGYVAKLGTSLRPLGFDTAVSAGCILGVHPSCFGTASQDGLEGLWGSLSLACKRVRASKCNLSFICQYLNQFLCTVVGYRSPQKNKVFSCLLMWGQADGGVEILHNFL